MAATVSLSHPWYEFTARTGDGGRLDLTFSRPMGIDGLNFAQGDMDDLVAAVVSALDNVGGVTSVTVTLHDDATTDVTPTP